MTFVIESIIDILKPKSKGEIEKSLDELSGEDLWYLAQNTSETDTMILYLKKAIKKPDLEDYIDAPDIAEMIVSYSELEKDFLPLIIKKFDRDFKITKTKNGYNLYAYEGWDAFSDYFSSNISNETIEKILSGDAYDVFDQGNYIDNISEYEWSVARYFDHLNYKPLKKKTLQVIKKARGDFSELEKLEGFTNVFEFISKHQENEELHEIIEAIKSAFYETQIIADEYEAYEDIKKTLIKAFGLTNKPKFRNEYMILPVTSDTLIKMFRIAEDMENGIDLYEPQNGWDGDIGKFPDVFNDALLNKLEDINDRVEKTIDFVKEGLGDILKPKSEDDIKQSYDYLELNKKIDFLRDKRNRDIIPRANWPLIVKINDDLYNDMILKRDYRVQSLNPIIYYASDKHHVDESMTVGFFFAIQSDNAYPTIIIEQLNNESFARVYMKNFDTNKKSKYYRIDSIKEFFDWFKKTGYTLNESLGDVLKPKSEEEIIYNFNKLSFSKQMIFLDDSNREIIPFENWPLIIRIKEQFKNDFVDYKHFRVSSIEEMYYRLGGSGAYFKIYYFNNLHHPVIIKQFSNKPHYVNVEIESRNSGEELIGDYSTFLKWFKENGYNDY